MAFNALNSAIALVRVASVPGVAKGQTLTIGGTSFTIIGDEPDGTGLVVLRLRLALASAKRGRRSLRARVAELEALDDTALRERLTLSPCRSSPSPPCWIRA